MGGYLYDRRVKKEKSNTNGGGKFDLCPKGVKGMKYRLCVVQIGKRTIKLGEDRNRLGVN